MTRSYTSIFPSFQFLLNPEEMVKMLRTLILVSYSFFMVIGSIFCTPPSDPIKCSPGNTQCTITNSYGAFPDRSVCRAADVAYPLTEEELMATVAEATKQKRKMKTATRFSHSIPKLVCPDGEDGLLISTKFLNHTLGVDRAAMTMTVESGVTLRQLIDEAAGAGLALPYSPYWWGLTIGGMLGTGAHGSSLWGEGSCVHDHVDKLKLVSPGAARDGYVQVRTLDRTNPDLNAAKVSLGVLGVVSQVTLRLQPMFKRSITYQTKTDSDLGDKASSFGSKHEFADITWLPSQKKAVYRIDDRLAATAPSSSVKGRYDFIGFRPTPSLTLSLLRTTEDLQESNKDVDGKCKGSKLITGTLAAAAYGLTNNGVIFTGYPVVGDQNRVQSSGTCLDSLKDGWITACPWDPQVNKHLFFHQTTFSIGVPKVKSFVEDVQRLIRLEPKSMCGLELYNGIVMRYVKASPAYLATDKDALDFDITYYRSKDPMAPRLYEDIIEEVEQIAIFKYKALPHWGKNRNVAFLGAIGKYSKAAEFLKVKEAYDPMGLFSSEWTDQVLGLRDGLTIDNEGCALEGLCVCSKDIHCAPSKGYFCQAGRIYEDAKLLKEMWQTKMKKLILFGP